MFKVGQKVRCKTYGEGVVTLVWDEGTHPVDVEFLQGSWEEYTVDGKLHEEDDEPCLTVIEE